MVTRKLLIRLGLLAVLLVGALLGYRWWTSPDRQIRRIADAVGAALSHEAPGTGLDALTAVAALQEHLTPDVALETGETGRRIVGRQDVVSTAARIRASTTYMRVRFFDVRIVHTSEASATVHATVDVTTRNELGEDVADARNIEATVVRSDGRWQVAGVRVIPRSEPVS